MNARQKIHQANLSKWTAIFQEQSSSHLTIKEWCSQNNISRHAFYYWKRILKDSIADSLLPDIIPVALTSPTPVPNYPALDKGSLKNSDDMYNSYNSPSPVTISIGDIDIKIGSSANDDVISAVIKAVRHA